MDDLVWAILAVGLPALTGLYWVCLIVGAGLLLIGALAGGDTDVGADVDVDVSLDADVGADVDVPVDGHAHPGHASASALAGWFSMQFLVFFVAMFGVVGVVMTYLTEQGAGVNLGCAVVGGLVVGQGVHQLLRELRRSSGDSTPQPRDYVDKLGRVTVTIAGGRQGEVALRVGRAERFVPALPKHEDQTFTPGEYVGVVAYQSGVAEVVSRREYEFLKG
jgi:hypothetical protein